LTKRFVDAARLFGGGEEKLDDFREIYQGAHAAAKLLAHDGRLVASYWHEIDDILRAFPSLQKQLRCNVVIGEDNRADAPRRILAGLY